MIGGADKNLDTYRAQKGVNDVFRRTENKGTACFPSDRICYRCGTRNLPAEFNLQVLRCCFENGESVKSVSEEIEYSRASI